MLHDEVAEPNQIPACHDADQRGNLDPSMLSSIKAVVDRDLVPEPPSFAQRGTFLIPQEQRLGNIFSYNSRQDFSRQFKENGDQFFLTTHVPYSASSSDEFALPHAIPYGIPVHNLSSQALVAGDRSHYAAEVNFPQHIEHHMRSNEEATIEIEAMGVFPHAGHDSQLSHNAASTADLPFPSTESEQREERKVEAERTLRYTCIGPRPLSLHPYYPLQAYIVNGREQVESRQGAGLSQMPTSMTEAHLLTYMEFHQDSGDSFSVFPLADSWAGHASWPRWSHLPNV